MATHSSARKRTVIGLVAAVLSVVVLAAMWGLTSRSSAGAGPPLAALPEGAAVGVVELNVASLATVRSYYVDAVGLEVMTEAEGEVLLGLEQPLLRLTAGAGDSTTPTGAEAGLYHSAILYPDAPALATVLQRVATIAPESFQGSSDHGVSEAFYFVDPEGNGLELYVDTPRDEWVWEDGQVRMGSAMLDPNAFMAEHLGKEAGAGATMGHVHLKVGDLKEAEAFYAEALGFAVTARTDGALFYAVDGYHHHLATNTWQSAGAEHRANPLGLGSFEVTVPAAAELETIVARLDEVGVAHTNDGGDIVTADPWGNEVRITSR